VPDLNPSLPQSVIDREYAKDAASAAAEYGAEFRTDVEDFIALEVVEACAGDHVERLPLQQHLRSEWWIERQLYVGDLSQGGRARCHRLHP
jgi:hypothetical protein